MHGFQWQRLLPVALIPLVAACGSSRGPKTLVVTPAQATVAEAAPPVRPAEPVEDPVVTLINTSERHFKAGQTELEQGHVEAAKLEFDRAVNVLLESPYGGRTEPRVREHFDRLVDRISTYEVRALATGDGFTEKKYEAASIDELLALSATLGTPPAAPSLTDTTFPFR
jgi:membrane-bound lytic murein transglycosylase D